MSTEGNNHPVHACGTRFVSHKVAALERVIERFGAYLAHLTTITENSRVQSDDRHKMKGYVLKWQNYQVLLGCTPICDILKTPSTLFNALKEDEICMVRAVECILKTKRSLDKLKTTPFEEPPTVKMVIGRIKHDNDSISYQGVDLKKHNQSISYLKAHMKEWIEAMDNCFKNCIKGNEIGIITHAVTLLATNGWECSALASFGYEALEAVCDWFHFH